MGVYLCVGSLKPFAEGLVEDYLRKGAPVEVPITELAISHVTDVWMALQYDTPAIWTYIRMICVDTKGQMALHDLNIETRYPQIGDVIYYLNLGVQPWDDNQDKLFEVNPKEISSSFLLFKMEIGSDHNGGPLTEVPPGGEFDEEPFSSGPTVEHEVPVNTSGCGGEPDGEPETAYSQYVPDFSIPPNLHQIMIRNRDDAAFFKIPAAQVLDEGQYEGINMAERSLEENLNVIRHSAHDLIHAKVLCAKFSRAIYRVKRIIQLKQAELELKNNMAILNWDKEKKCPKDLTFPSNSGSNDDARAANKVALFPEDFREIADLQNALNDLYDNEFIARLDLDVAVLQHEHIRDTIELHQISQPKPVAE